MAPQKSEIKQLVTSTESKVHSLKAGFFHTMSYKMSLEINKGNVTLPTRRSFLEVLYNVCQIKKKQITFEQYYRVHVNGPKIAICEITSDTVFVLNSSPQLSSKITLLIIPTNLFSSLLITLMLLLSSMAS